eukprot:6209208-Amphidinium_carterae.1
MDLLRVESCSATDLIVPIYTVLPLSACTWKSRCCHSSIMGSLDRVPRSKLACSPGAASFRAVVGGSPRTSRHHHLPPGSALSYGVCKYQSSLLAWRQNHVLHETVLRVTPLTPALAPQKAMVPQGYLPWGQFQNSVPQRAIVPQWYPCTALATTGWGKETSAGSASSAERFRATLGCGSRSSSISTSRSSSPLRVETLAASSSPTQS